MWNKMYKQIDTRKAIQETIIVVDLLLISLFLILSCANDKTVRKDKFVFNLPRQLMRTKFVKCQC